jgi:hypothetical protein
MIRTLALLLIVEEAFDNVEHIKEVIETEIRLRYVTNKNRKRSQRLVIMVILLPENGLSGISIEEQEVVDDIPARVLCSEPFTEVFFIQIVQIDAKIVFERGARRARTEKPSSEWMG